MKKLEPWYIAVGNVKMWQLPWKTSLVVPPNVKHETTIGLGDPTPRYAVPKN